MKHLAVSLLVVLALALFLGCEPIGNESEPKVWPQAKLAPDPLTLEEHIEALASRPDADDGVVEVEHILIAFKGSERSTQSRSKSEALRLVREIHEKLLKREDFGKLKEAHTDDPGQKTAGSTYTMFDSTKGGSSARNRFDRKDMAKGFGDTSWRLNVGEWGIADYNKATSPFGWHIIRRVK
ncbi:MAG: peptidylprolyl isomerase [Planctomycetes bacterium]|nr:peptidylprolyl isomerase [Planctomycetota bacterium]